MRAFAAVCEAVPPRRAGSPVCVTCGRETGPGPTRRFRDFVDGLLPASGNYATTRKRLYEIRSSLVHGTYVLHFDEDPWMAGFSEAGMEQSRAYGDLHNTTQRALVEWLRQRASAAATSVAPAPEPSSADRQEIPPGEPEGSDGL